MNQKIFQIAKPYLLPFLMALFPPLFFYGANAEILLLPSLVRITILSIILATVVYAIFFIIKRQATKSANATFVFLVFFHTYGIVYDYLQTMPGVSWEGHNISLPFSLLIALLASWFVSKMNISRSTVFWNNLVLIMGMLIVFNIAKISLAEIKKNTRNASAAVTITNLNLPVEEYPDIYFIIFDEFSGFEPMREYWKNPRVDGFVNFLESKGFFVAEQSHTSSIMSIHQMAMRLNYEDYPCCEKKDFNLYYEKISDNRAMQYLKSRGYSTVTIEELSEFLDAALPINADYAFNYDENPDRTLTSALFDEFGIFVADNSMLRAFPTLYNQSAILERAEHVKFIRNAVNRVVNLDQVRSPKFVYVHLVFPHKPFMFDQNGKLLPRRLDSYWNWKYYPGQYNYSMKIAKEMVNDILAASDPDRLPVIILQSDHGARNIKANSRTTIMDNFPEEFKTSIMFALYIPGHDMSDLPQDINPNNTFPVVFNLLFDDHIPLIK